MKKTYIALAILLVVAAYLYTCRKKPLSMEDLAAKYENKVVLICGASSGIGEEVVYQLAEVGAKVMIVARRENRLISVKEEALKRGGQHARIEYMVYDFSDVKNSGKVVDKTIEVFGKLDYLIANHAGGFTGTFLAFPHLQEPDLIEKAFRINTFSMIQLAIKSLPHLEKTSGHIYVTSSIGGEFPFSTQHHIYCASKHALNGFFYSLQSELIFKKSKVSLTVGSLGLIATKDITAMFDRLDSIPEIYKGSVETCAKLMIEAYIERPRTMTYPPSNWISRFLWLLNPKFHESIHDRGYFNADYEDSIKLSIKRAKKAKEIDFQMGYNEGFENNL